MSAFQGLGRALRRLRTKAGLTQADVGQILGVGDQTIAKWERPEWGHRADTVDRYLTALKADAYDLAGALDEENGRTPRNLGSAATTADVEQLKMLLERKDAELRESNLTLRRLADAQGSLMQRYNAAEDELKELRREYLLAMTKEAREGGDSSKAASASDPAKRKG